jgi:hypothetical protein
MKKFLIKIFLFSIILLSLALVAQILIDVRIRNKVASGHDNLDLNSGQYNDLVFLGSSRCFAHFNPALFHKALGLSCINLGVDGHSELTMHVLRLSNYLAKNRPPRFAILNIDPFTSAGSMDSNENLVDKYNFARYAFMPSAANDPIVRYFHFNFVERYIPLYALLRYKVFFECLTLPYNKDWIAQGYNKHDEQWDTASIPVKQLHQIAKLYFDTTSAYQDAIKSELARIDSICSHNQVRLICVQTPVFKTAYDSSYFSYPRQLCSELGIPFFDLNDKSIDDDISNFYNTNHLNTKGVAKMTANMLSNPGVLQILSSKGTAGR